MNNREKLIKKVEHHLRMTARQLVKFDTEEEALQYLTDSFQSELNCDFVGIILKEGEHLIPKVWRGGFQKLKKAFPLRISSCTTDLFTHSLTFYDVSTEAACEFLRLLQTEKMETWFTVPLQDESNNYGFCTIGFIHYTPLLEMDKIFEEFGRDTAVALSLAKQKEAERKKIVGMEWVSQNLSLNESVENLISRLVERAGRGTGARLAGIYLYNEKENCFTFQPPSYGDFTKPKQIFIKKNYILKEYFPYVEQSGGNELTVPMVIDLKTIGVLHIENKEAGVFTKGDLEILELLANHVASMLENARLYNSEKDNKQRLQSLLDHQQVLIKETVEKDDFAGITSELSKLMSKAVILFDRFMRPISHHLLSHHSFDLEKMADLAISEVFQYQSINPSIIVGNTTISVWPINGGGDLLGYLAVNIRRNEMDDFDKLTIDMVRNIYSVQFIKQKLVMDAKEQVKDSFVNKLLVENIEDKESIIQYANLFQWNLFNLHRVAVLSVYLDKAEVKDDNILEQQAKKSLISDQLKTRIQMHEPNLLMANNSENYILITPAEDKNKDSDMFWNTLIKNINKWLFTGKVKSQAYLGIGGKTNTIEGYYNCYQQAIQALQVVTHRHSESRYAYFENLGSYTLLYQLKNTASASLFMKDQLKSLLQHSEGKKTDLFHTLRTYLQQNGHIKNTAMELYIHRSSLLYRLEKIETLLNIDLTNADHRFNIMMAYKMYDLTENDH